MMRPAGLRGNATLQAPPACPFPPARDVQNLIRRRPGSSKGKAFHEAGDVRAADFRVALIMATVPYVGSLLAIADHKLPEEICQLIPICSSFRRRISASAA
jgi:hypothetical protein